VVGVCRAEKEDEEIPEENAEAIETEDGETAVIAPETAAEAAPEAEQPVTGETPADPE
jgi:hypothetical protein